MLEPRERGVLAESLVRQAHPHSFVPERRILLGPRIAQRDPRRPLGGARRITPGHGRTARHQHFDDGARRLRGQRPHLGLECPAAGCLEAEPLGACGEPLEVQLEKPRRAVHAADRLEQAVAEMQPAIERRHLARGAAVDPHELRVHGKPPRAASSPRALARVSSSSRSGSESATMPAPARKLSCRAESVIERMRMLRSSRPSRVR